MNFDKKYFVGLAAFFCASAIAASAQNSSLPEKIDILECDGSKVELVSTCQNDTVAKSEDHSGLPVCTDQIIKINGQENRRKIEKISQLTSSGSTVKILSNVVVSMACVKGSKGSLISIGGYGGCGACPEWHGYYSLDGKLVNYVYSNSFRSFGSLGTRDDLINKFGVSKRDLVDESSFAKKITYPGI